MFSLDQLGKYIAEGWVKVQQHPTEALFIYNYTPKTQYEANWDEVTLNCRGLILNGAGELIARPFPKFFNLGEQENQLIPNEPFEVYEKMDGSLGILYWKNGEAFIASRGSFASDQAQVANQILQTKYQSILKHLDPANTYLFEIIYPQNRIVVDYGEQKDLVLLGVIHTASGQELPLPQIGFPVVKKYDGLNNIEALSELEEENREGFVIRFKNGLRYKVKFKEYVRIHRIITNVSNISIWEYLKTGQDFEPLLDRVPDEFYGWVKQTKQELEDQYLALEQHIKNDFKVLETRKATALYFQSCKYPGILFSMLDEKDYSEKIWKLLRPNYARPFLHVEEAH